MEMIKKLLAIHQWWGFNVTLIIMKIDLLDIFLWKKFKILEQVLTPRVGCVIVSLERNLLWKSMGNFIKGFLN
ncbi:hypothetical protein YC2023_053127 [Brassica napus]